MIMLTVLTTTYNRSGFLYKCYKSLCEQTCYDFEWLIIDDGSSDNTFCVVEQIMKEHPYAFPIVYKKKKNGGKHTALNFSHEFINGKYVIMLDDDDELTRDAVEIVLSDWKKYKNDSNVGWITYLKAEFNTRKPCIDFGTNEPIVANPIEFMVNEKRRGDCAEVIRTDVFKAFQAPIFINEYFLSEDYLWINASFQYDSVYINKTIYLYEYLNDGLTRTINTNRLKNPKGGMYTCNLYFDKRISKVVQYRKAILYDCYAYATKTPMKYVRQSKSISKCMIVLPVAWLVYKMLFRRD